MSVRTDFCDELICEHFEDEKVVYKKGIYEYGEIVHIDVKEEGNTLEKEVGKYITISFEDLDEEEQQSRVQYMLKEELKQLLPAIDSLQKVLVVGLGNRDIVCDALGANVVDQIFVTSHLIREQLLIEGVVDVSAVAFGVMGQTGIESFSFVKNTVDFIKPDVVIVIDALMTSALSRLNKVIQMNTVGIKPGSGVANHRLALDEQSLECPIIAIGVATVTSVNAILHAKEVNVQVEEDENLIVTPKDMDVALVCLSQLIAHAINDAIHD